MIRNCKVCGVSYDTNHSCERGRSWRVHTDTIEHYYIMMVIMGYQADHDAKRAYEALNERGIDVRDSNDFIPSVRKIMAEIATQVFGRGNPEKTHIKPKIVVDKSAD